MYVHLTHVDVVADIKQETQLYKMPLIFGDLSFIEKKNCSITE